MDHYIWNRHSVSRIWNCISNGTFYRLIYPDCLNDGFYNNNLQKTIVSFLSISFLIFHFSSFSNRFLNLLVTQIALRHLERLLAVWLYHRKLVELPTQPKDVEWLNFAVGLLLLQALASNDLPHRRWQAEQELLELSLSQFQHHLSIISNLRY